VLVFTIAATANLTSGQRIELGFATTLFALGFVGCLLCAYSFASLSGEKSSVATLTNSMFLGSGLSVCIVAVLGGFEALAAAFLPDSAPVFLIVCTALACVASPFVWFPHWDTLQRFGPPRYSGPPQNRQEAGRLLLQVGGLGMVAAVAGALIHFSDVMGHPEHWQYLGLTFVGLIYTSAMVLAALWISTRSYRARISIRLTWVLAFSQSCTIAVLIALLP
jgi:hypothetical protein